jgi:hypothetical protein
VNVNWREGEELLKKARKMNMKLCFIRYPMYTYSFRRLNKVGALKMLQEMSQLEIIKAVRGGLTIKDTSKFYPMNGGSFYKNDKESKVSLRKFISILFQDKPAGKNSFGLFKKGVNSGKGFFG